MEIANRQLAIFTLFLTLRAMQIRFYNTLSNRVEDFEPIDPPRLSMYNCGPTVYDFQTIGNFRTFLFADVLRRFLELVGYQVQQVMNLTDVGHMTEDQLADGGGEDKMNLAVKHFKEAKKVGTVPSGAAVDSNDPYAVAGFFIEAFVKDAMRLGLKVASEYPRQMPRATDHVGAMVGMIRSLIATDHAYATGEGAVYYSVESFPAYGSLSGNTIEKLRGGEGGRVLEEHQAQKRHPADFLLWKADSSHLMKWPSPWGEGYPGWHIECSAMARVLLGRDVIDIHTGGEDNIFPHHECEIAQSCGVSGRDCFARHWIHARHLLVDGQKMSKSKRNFHTAADVLDGKVTGKPVDPAVLRYELIRSHYRSNSSFTLKGLADSAHAVQRLRDFAARQGRCEPLGGSAVDEHPVLSSFCHALADDLNVSGALGAVFKWVAASKDEPALALGVLRRIDSVLGVLGEAEESDGEGEARTRCRAIDHARAERDFAAADQLREQLIDAGYEVHTTKKGTIARKSLG